MLFTLLLVIITISLCFLFLFYVVFNGSFMIPVVNENAKIRLALAIHRGSPVAVANDAIEMPSLVADNKIVKSSNIFTNSFTH